MLTFVQLVKNPFTQKAPVLFNIEWTASEKPNPMIQHSLIWIEPFKTLFASKSVQYRAGARNVEDLFSQNDTEFLYSIGSTPQEIFDFVEDWCDNGEPDPDTALAITRIRWEYLLNEQGGKHSEHVVSPEAFPSRRASLAGLEWFPRIIEKARAKLRGELPPDLMYACGGDRRFLKKIRVDPVEFLRITREAGDNVESIVKFVTNRVQSS